MAEEELGLLKCHYSGLIIVWWQKAIILVDKNGTFLTTLLHSWQQTKLPSVLLLLTLNVPRKALGVKSTREVLQNGSNPALYPPPHVTDMGNFHT